MKIIFYLFLGSLLLSNLVGWSQEDVGQFEQLYPSEEVVTRYHNDWTQSSYKRRIANFKADQLHFGEIVFIGNSITQQGGDWSEKFGIEGIRNRGIAGDVTDGVLKRLDEIIYFKPKAVFLLIGVNDLFNMHHDADSKRKLKYDKIIPSAKYVARNIRKIAKRIHRKLPDTEIFVRTILPTRRNYLKEDIVTVNSILRSSCDGDYIKIIDFYSEFVDANGDMKKELTKDGVHLNELGYQKWVQIEKSMIEKICQSTK